jgi:hypothetical protein
MIFLVVLYHCGLVYESSGIGAYFWIVDDPATNDLSGIINLIVDIFVMSALFFISGYFAPLSVKSKKGWAFIKSKFNRLILPWTIAVLTLVPIYKFIFLYSRDLPQDSWETYFHFSNSIFGQSWLWFLPVLFAFELIYLFFTKLNIKMPEISLKSGIWLTFLIGWAYSVGMALIDARGWTKTPLLDFQNERLLIYFMMFLLGALCFKLKIFESRKENKKLTNLVHWTSWLPITLYIGTLIYSLVKPDDYIFSRVIDQGLMRLFFHISLVSLLYTVIVIFRRSFNTQSRLSKVLSDNSYYVYIIHTIVIGVIALGLLDTALPSMAKYFILATSTYVACNLMVWFFRRVFQRKSGLNWWGQDKGRSSSGWAGLGFGSRSR